MSTFLSGVVNCAKYLLWGNDTQIQTPSEPEEVIVKNLFPFTSEMNKENYIENLCACIKQALAESDYDLSQTSQKVIESHLKSFNAAMDEPSYLTVTEVKNMKNDFKKSLGQIIKEGWASLMAKSFYPIPRIDDEKLRASASEKWAQQFYAGVDYFTKWEGAPADCESIVLQAFRDHSHNVKQQKMEAIIARAQKDPIGFDQLVLTAHSKKENTSSLSEEEKKFLESEGIMRQYLFKNLSDIDKELDLLKQSIWQGFTFELQ
ncbi:MAG TPA: hypothetical protein VLG49_01740 [Rhabdochlamydiaceae bacterium]|nr:hypothetical protein [Rhabdochlamydiaceae bacterium]